MSDPISLKGRDVFFNPAGGGAGGLNLWLYRRMIFGPLEKPGLRNISDMSYREVLVFTTLVLLVILFGFYPAPLLDVTAVSVKKLVANYEVAIRAASAMSGR